MKSTIVLTIKCLVLSGLIIAGCTIAETIDFNFDFSGTRTVEFQYRELSEDGFVSNEDNPMPHGLRYIDSISHWVDNVSNFQIDTSDYEMAKLTYDFTEKGLQVNNQKRYTHFVDKMPEEMQWYFKERPNTFKVLNENQVLWNAVHRNVHDIDFESLMKLSSDHEDITTVTTLNFERTIKDIQPKLEELFISPDRKSLTTEINLDEVFELKRANEVIITFDE